MRIDFLTHDQKLELELCISRLAQLNAVKQFNEDNLAYTNDQMKTVLIKIEVLARKGNRPDAE